jgi:hypothetical protein
MNAEAARMSLQAVAACSWLYKASGPSDGKAESTPAPFGETVEFYVQDEMNGYSMKWAAIWNKAADQACFVFCGSCTLFDWILENPAIKYARKTSDVGPILVHTGFWTAVDNECERLVQAFEKVR